MGWENGSSLLMIAGLAESLNNSLLVFTKDADDTTLNLDVVRGHHDRSHFRICGLKTNLAGAFAIKALQSCFFAANQRHHDVTGIGDLGLFADDEISVHDVILDHGRALDLQDEGIAATREIAKRNRFAFFHGLQRTSGGDPSHERKLLQFAIADLILDRLRQLDDFDGAALVIAAPNETFFLERGDVLVHGGQRSEFEAFANFFEARRVAVLGLKGHEVIEDLFLPFGQSHAPPPLVNDVSQSL